MYRQLSSLFINFLLHAARKPISTCQMTQSKLSAHIQERTNQLAQVNYSASNTCLDGLTRRSLKISAREMNTNWWDFLVTQRLPMTSHVKCCGKKGRHITARFDMFLPHMLWKCMEPVAMPHVSSTTMPQ